MELNIDFEKLASQAQALALEFGVNLIAALAIFIIGRWVAKAVRGGLRKGMEKAKVDPTLHSFIGNLVYVGLLLIVILAAVSKLGVQTASFIAVLGAAGLAVGLALQGSLANFASGVLIIFFRPYKVGDYIEAGGVAGSVTALQIFNTVLTTPDNRRVVVPNSQITGDAITNYSANDTRRIDLVIGVSYSDDLGKTADTLKAILDAEPRVLAEPAPTIAVSELGDSSVNFVVRPWVKTSEYWPTRFDLMRTIKERFDAEDISFPFPQRDVHLFQESGGEA
jgi:small conductance mechanosensitive channel